MTSARTATAVDRAAPPAWATAGLGAYALAGGLLTLLGYALDLPRLTDWEGSGISQMPNNAVAVSLCGAALVLLGFGRRRAAAALGGTAALIGAATLSQYATGLDLGIDRLLVFREWGQRGTVVPGRMGPPGSTSLTVLGAAIVLAAFPRTRRFAPAGGLVVIGIATLSLVGYAFGADPLYTIPRLTTIALQTATMLLALGVGLVAAVPDAQPMRLLREDSAAAPLLRRAWPVLVVLTVALGWLRMWGQDAGLFDTAFGTAGLVLALIAVVTALLWWAAAAVATHERRARETRGRLTGVLESVSDAILILDRDWRFVFVNGEMHRRTGKPTADLLGKGVWEVFPDLVGSVPFLELHRAMAGQVGVEYEYLYEPYRRWFADKAYPTPDGGLAIFSRDVTGRKRADEKLRRSHDTFLNLIQNAPLGVYLVDSEFRLARVSAGAQKAFQNVRPLIGRDFADIVRTIWPEPFASEVIARFHHTLATGEPYHTADTTEQRADSPDVESYDWQIERVALPDGRHGVVCYFYDLTELKRAERALRDADRRKDEFLATLAHELRNPLAPLRNSLELLKRAPGDAAAATPALATMDRQLGQMVRLIDDLLDVSRITRDKLDLRTERVELASVLYQAVEACRPLADGSNHAVTVDVPPGPVYLHADPARLAQVFGNLLTNAYKYTEPGGRIRVTAACQGGEVVVAVRDSGLGIPADMLPKVFDMFTQVDRTLERAQGGLGLGLTLVKRLVELHGGTVAAHSDGPGCGSEFVVRLPTLAAGPQPSPSAPAAGLAPAVPRRVLVVDDNRDAAETLSLLLGMTGHEVRTAYDGAEAMEAAAEFRPDLVLCDIGLPKLNGYDVCRAIRGRPWGGALVMVALTGWGQEDDRRKSREAGFDHHLVKPVDPAALAGLLAAAPAPARQLDPV